MMWNVSEPKLGNDVQRPKLGNDVQRARLGSLGLGQTGCSVPRWQ